jgi:hypothetical protein
VERVIEPEELKSISAADEDEDAVDDLLSSVHPVTK